MNETTGTAPLNPDQLAKMNAYWRAANYLSVGQIYLKDNPLLERPLNLDDVKPRLLGHWGTTPGLNFLYVHWNRLIRERDLNMMYIIGPGHGGPGLVANTIWKVPTARFIRISSRTKTELRGYSGNSAGRTGFPAMLRRRRRDRFMRAASWATRWSMPTARPSTIPTSLWPAWLATARLRQARWRRAGTETSFSIPRPTARCCRFCISTATRSPIRRCWRAFRMRSWRA